MSLPGVAPITISQVGPSIADGSLKLLSKFVVSLGFDFAQHRQTPCHTYHLVRNRGRASLTAILAVLIWRCFGGYNPVRSHAGDPTPGCIPKSYTELFATCSRNANPG